MSVDKQNRNEKKNVKKAKDTQKTQHENARKKEMYNSNATHFPWTTTPLLYASLTWKNEREKNESQMKTLIKTKQQQEKKEKLKTDQQRL